MKAIDKFNELGGNEEPSAIERLRFFCSIALNNDDWLKSEKLFDALTKPSLFNHAVSMTRLQMFCMASMTKQDYISSLPLFSEVDNELV